ncbi:MAG TPA: IS481 family transposase [Solirubrobacteraceae bacterium]|jgi:transposase InsO family protein|nr:IS481 family transposase [Solirubrobacteraceae bacterium]
MEDRRCKLGLAGRLELVRLVEEGASLRAAAEALGVAPATAHRWWHRWREASEAQRTSRACLQTRRPVPQSCPWALSEEQEQAILSAREKTNWGPMRLTYLTGRRRSTIWKVLHRHGCSQRRRSARRESSRRYEWSEAGALLHIDAFQVPKFEAPGHWATGRRKQRSRRVGKTVVIGVIDDHTRLAYCELHSAENALNVSATLARSARWFEEQGCGPVQAVMSDNAKCYATSVAFREALARLGARHIQIPPYTPRWNGKIERFFGTLDNEWAHGRIWSSSTERDRSLSSFVRFYNRRRPHSAAGGRAPISRVQQVCGQDN